MEYSLFNSCWTIVAPKIHVPADAPADFDINQLLVQSHGEDEGNIEVEAEYVYEDVDTNSLSLASAFVSSKDPATLTNRGPTNNMNFEKVMLQ